VTDDELLKVICDFFVQSNDFNGAPGNHLVRLSGSTWPGLRSQLARLIEARKIDLALASLHENPHIKRLPNPPVNTQLTGLLEESIDGICIYPSSDLISARPDLHQYDDRPYTRRLALAEPQLQAAFFELNVRRVESFSAGCSHPMALQRPNLIHGYVAYFGQRPVLRRECCRAS
jgi:hypothetical protein